MMKAQKISVFRLCALLLVCLAGNSCRQNYLSRDTIPGDQAALATMPMYAFYNKSVAQQQQLSSQQTVAELLAECKRQMSQFEDWMSRGMMQPHQ